MLKGYFAPLTPKGQLELSLILRQAVKSQKSWNRDFGSWEYIDGSSREK